MNRYDPLSILLFLLVLIIIVAILFPNVIGR